MNLMPGLFVILWWPSVGCLDEDGGFTVDGDLRHFVVAADTVFIATDEKLHQLSRDLTLVNTVSQRGILKGNSLVNDVQFYRVSETEEWNVTFSVNLLLPFVKNDTLISCGVTDNKCGYCELLDLGDISKVLYKEYILVGPLEGRSASVAFLVSVGAAGPITDTYILTATQQKQDASTQGSCSSATETVYLHDTNNNRIGGIFSNSDDSSAALFKSKGEVEFVDGFQIGSVIYLLSNVPSELKGNRVRLVWLEGKRSKILTMKSLRGASLEVPGAPGSRLRASSVVPGGPPVLWGGVFSVDGGPRSTELHLFNISSDLTAATDKDPDFCSAVSCSGNNHVVGGWSFHRRYKISKEPRGQSAARCNNIRHILIEYGDSLPLQHDAHTVFK